MPTPTPEDVQAVLSDFHVRLRRVVDEAWREWLAVSFRGRLLFEARARAVLVFDFIAQQASAEFVGDPNIRMIIRRQTIQFLFRDVVLLRFKKGNKRGIGSNIRTQAVLDFIDPQRAIPGLIPEIMKVEVCYIVDDLGVGLDEVAVVARDERSRLWAYQLERPAPAEVVPLPPRAPDESPAVVVPRQPRTDEKSETQE